MKSKRLVYGTLAVCLLALFLNASAVLGIGNETRLLSSSPGSRQERVPVGVLLPFSGQYSRMSENIFRVIQMIAEEVNKHGGIGGRKVVLVKGDTRARADIGAVVSQRLVDVDGVIAFIGPSSLSFTGVKKTIRNNKVPMISPTAGITELDRAGRMYFYRTVPSDSLGGRAIVRAITGCQLFLGLDRRFSSVVMMIGRLPAMISFKRPIQDGMDEFGGSLTDLIEYETGKDSYEEEIHKALEAAPDIIILIGTPRDSVLIMDAALEAGYQGWWFVTQDQTNDEFIRLAGSESVRHVYGVQETSPKETIDRVEAFKKRFKDYWGENLGPFGTSTYDASNILFLAMLRVELRDGELGRETVAKNIPRVANGGSNKVEVTDFLEGKQILETGKEINYQGLDGPMDFDDYGNVVTPYAIRQVREGVWRTIATINVHDLKRQPRATAMPQTLLGGNDVR